MKKIQPGQYGRAVCAVCGNKPQWRATRLAQAFYVCDAHRPVLETKERESRAVESSLTEADYQTWMRL